MALPQLENHIVLVSAQPLPTLLGVSLPGSEPSRIHAIVTPPMRNAVRLLRKALAARGRQCELTEYPLENMASQEAMYAVLDAIRSECAGSSMGLNLTGGTKLMALAASEWAYANDLPAFYIDTEGEQIVSIGRSWSYASLPDVLTVRGLLAAHGFELESGNSNPVPAARRAVLSRMLEVACTPAGAKALGHLNRLAELARGALYACDDAGAPGAWADLLALCAEAGTAHASKGNIVFANEEGRHWCNGLWFEEYVKMTLYHLKGSQRVKDFVSSARVRAAGVLNELDAMFTARNRLFAIECKTSAMCGVNAAQNDHVSSYLYKLDSLRDRLGGSFARAMLGSVRPLAAKDIERARNMNVSVLCGRDLLSLGDKLVSWSNEA